MRLLGNEAGVEAAGEEVSNAVVLFFVKGFGKQMACIFNIAKRSPKTSAKLEKKKSVAQANCKAGL
jgi:hypothetical protein